MRRILDRYILREIALPFLLIIVILTFVLLIGRIFQLTDLMVNKGVSLFEVAGLIFYLVPSLLVFTIPIALLISILIGLGRLSGDNEWIVLKASGISLYQLLSPIAAASLLAFLMTAAASLFLVPYGNYATKKLLFDIAKQKASIGIKEKTFNDDFKGILLYADRIPIDGNHMEGVLISDSRLVQEPTIIVARRAYLVSDPQSLIVTLRLEGGSIHSVGAGMKSYRKIAFRSYDINLDIESSLAAERKLKTKEGKEMTVRELIRKLRKPDLEKSVFRELAIQLYKKLTIPFSCLVFGILGIPLGLTAHRSVKSRGFIIGLFVVTGYYLLQLGGDALAETGRLSPLLGTWAPNVIFGAAGIALFAMAARERTLRFPSLPRLSSKERCD